MQIVINMLISNAIFATVLAVFVFAVTRISKNHFAAHLLWLLVLVKLLVPPLVGVMPPSIEWKQMRSSNEARPLPLQSLAADQPSLVEYALDDVQDLSNDAQPIVQSNVQREREPSPERKQSLVHIATAIWLVGSVLWCIVASYRLTRFSKLLRKHAFADEQIQMIAERVAARIGLRLCPQIMLTTAKVPPFVWAPWKPIVVLPRDLVMQLDFDQVETLIAHELTHLRRGDHWIRRFEMVLAAVYWWHPIFWWAAHELHVAEEKCCDASVVQDFPKHTFKYGEVLLKAAEFVCPALPATAIPIGQGSQLKERVSMVLNQGFSRRLSLSSSLAVGALAVALLPMAVPGMEPPLVGPPQSTEVAGKPVGQVGTDGELGEKVVDSATSVSAEAAQADSENQEGESQFVTDLTNAGNGFNHSDSGGITGVFLTQPNVDGEVFRQLQELPELEYIALARTSFATDDLVHLRDLKRLKQLLLNGQQFNEESLVYLRAIPNLRALFLTGESIDRNKCQLLKQLPDLEEVRLTRASMNDGDLKVLQELPKLSAITLLNSSQNQGSHERPRITDAGLVHLGGVQNLKSLNLGGGTLITDEGMAYLGNLTQLEELQLASNELTDKGISQLQGLVNLRVLRISDVPSTRPSSRPIQFTDVALQSLSRLTQLQEMHLQNGQFTNAGMEHLAGLTELKKVFLSRATVTADGLRHLRGAINLESLYLLGTNYDDEAIEQLRGLKNLKVVNLDQSQLTAKGLQDLASLKFVTSLNLSESRITDADLEHLKGLTTITRLDLNGTFITDAGMVHIASLINLENLSLWNTAISDAGLVHLQQLTSLTNLGLQNTRIGGEGLRHVSHLRSLSRLIVGGTAITDAGLKYLDGMDHLKHLWLSDSPQITDEGIRNLHGLKLESLELGNNSPWITDASMASLGQMKSLKHLSLDGTRITDKGLVDLVELPNLEHLNLRNTDITDEGLALLPTMPNLRWLTLDRTRITDEGLKFLKEMPNLKILWIGGTRVSKSAFEDLQRSLPKCKIRWE